MRALVSVGSFALPLARTGAWPSSRRVGRHPQISKRGRPFCPLLCFPPGRASASKHVQKIRNPAFTPQRKSLHTRPFGWAASSQGRKMRGEDGVADPRLFAAFPPGESCSGWVRPGVSKSQKKGLFETICEEGSVNAAIWAPIHGHNRGHLGSHPRPQLGLLSGFPRSTWASSVPPPTSTPPQSPAQNVSNGFHTNLPLPKWREGKGGVGREENTASARDSPSKPTRVGLVRSSHRQDLKRFRQPTGQESRYSLAIVKNPSGEV